MCRTLTSYLVFSAGKDTESQVQSQQTREGELQLVVEQRAFWEDPLLDADLNGTLRDTQGG